MRKYFSTVKTKDRVRTYEDDNMTSLWYTIEREIQTNQAYEVTILVKDVE